MTDTINRIFAGYTHISGVAGNPNRLKFLFADLSYFANNAYEADSSGRNRFAFTQVSGGRWP